MTAATHAEDLAWARNWLRHAAGDWGNCRNEDWTEQQQLVVQLKRIHQRRRGAFDWLMDNDQRANRIATHLGLIGQADSWQAITPQQIRAKVRSINDSPAPMHFGHILAGALARYAPHHLGLLPPQWLDQLEQQPPPLRAAASTIPSSVRRSPPIDADVHDA